MSTLALADRVRFADRAPSSAPAPLVLRRACACGGTPGSTGECEGCRKKRLGVQRSASAAGPALAPPIVHGVLRSPGAPLDAGTRAELEPRFRHSFADVRIHADSGAAASARAVGAHAYTVGRDVVFAAGRYAPGSAEGKRLLAHELAHVVQQRGAAASIQPRLEVGAVDDPAEREADRAADAVMRGGPATGLGAGAAPALRRQDEHEGQDPMEPLKEEELDRGPAPLETETQGGAAVSIPHGLTGRPRNLRAESVDVVGRVPGAAPFGAGLRVWGEGWGPVLTIDPTEGPGDTYAPLGGDRVLAGPKPRRPPAQRLLTPGEWETIVRWMRRHRPRLFRPFGPVPEGPSPPPAPEAGAGSVGLGAAGLRFPRPEERPAGAGSTLPRIRF